MKTMAVLRKAAEVAIGAFVLGAIIAAVGHVAFGYGPGARKGPGKRGSGAVGALVGRMPVHAVGA